MSELPEWNYLKKKKVGYQFKTDPTESWFITKNGRKVARNISTTTSGARQSFLLWKGWYTRLDRAAGILDRLEASKNRFWDKIARPELAAALGKKQLVKVHYLDKTGILSYVEISKGQGDYEGGMSYSSHNREDIGGQMNVRVADLIQTKGWDSLYKGWDNGFKDGQRLLWVLSVHDSKWNRYHRAQGILGHLISRKLEKIADKHKVGDVIEFVCGDRRYRFEKGDSRHARNNIWKELSSQPIQTVDISAIIPKYP
jgi:hypothetical protein